MSATNVKQNTLPGSSNWRSLILGSPNSSTEGFTPSSTTSSLYVSKEFSVNPTSGIMKASIFKGALQGTWGRFSNSLYTTGGILIYSADAESDDGSLGYIKIAHMKVSSNSNSIPFIITIARENDEYPTNIYLSFVYGGVNTFYIDGCCTKEDVLLNNPSDTEYDLYIKKIRSNDCIYVLDYHKDDSSDVTLTWTNEFTSSDIAEYAHGAGKLDKSIYDYYKSYNYDFDPGKSMGITNVSLAGKKNYSYIKFDNGIMILSMNITSSKTNGGTDEDFYFPVSFYDNEYSTVISYHRSDVFGYEKRPIVKSQHTNYISITSLLSESYGEVSRCISIIMMGRWKA